MSILRFSYGKRIVSFHFDIYLAYISVEFGMFYLSLIKNEKKKKHTHTHIHTHTHTQMINETCQLNGSIHEMDAMMKENISIFL